MIVNGDLATMVAVIEFEILSFLVGRKIDLIYLYATILSLSHFVSVYYTSSVHRFGWNFHGFRSKIDR